MLTKDYLGSVVEVKDLKNAFITAGKIVDVADGEIEISDPSGPLPLLPYRTAVKIAVFNANSGFRMLAGQIYMSNRNSMRVVDVLDFLEYERRRFFRLDIDASATLLIESELEDGTVEQERLPVRIRNLSLCGAMFLTERVFQIGDKFKLEMALYKSSEDVMDVVVQRIEKEQDSRYFYGVEIYNLDKRVETDLCGYLFDQQRQQIKRKRSVSPGTEGE